MFDWTDSLPDERPPGKVCVPLQLQQGVAGEGEEPGDPTPGSKQVTRQSARLARQEQLFRYLCRQPCICAWWQGCLVGRSVKGHFQKSSNPQPVLRWRHSTDSGTVFGMTLALNIIKEFHVMCHFYVPKIKKMHF